jgi:hypothetical protein
MQGPSHGSTRSFESGVAARRGGLSPALGRASALLLVAGCTVGAPPGFSSGDHWTFPLVGPLEDGLLITPASVDGHGPYLFAIDPDANVTAIDQAIVEDAGLRMGQGPHRIDETDTGQTRIYAELLNLQIAGLTIDRRDVMVFRPGMYDTEAGGSRACWAATRSPTRWCSGSTATRGSPC